VQLNNDLAIIFKSSRTQQSKTVTRLFSNWNMRNNHN